MSKGLKYLFIFIVAAAAVFVAVAMTLPQNSQVERSIVVKAPPEKIYPFIADHQSSLQWFPWTEKDPNIAVKYDTGTSGVNATIHWKSNIPGVGSGSSTFIELVKNEKVKASLDFGDMMVSTGELRLRPIEGGTNISWSFDMRHSTFMSRYFGLILESLVAPDFERGLSNLKKLAEAGANIVTQELSYTIGSQQFTGYLAYPDNGKKNPGVLIVHEWWGHNDYARKRSDMLAEMGFAAFALDMYGDGKVAEHPEQAQAFMMEVMQQQDAAAERFDAALALFKSQAATDSENIAAIGYCFGGAVVLSMARAGKALKGVVSFHGALGGLPAVAQHTTLAPALVFNGAADPLISAEDIAAFKNSMDAANAPYQFISYPDVQHSFTNPGANALGEKFALPLQYNEQADKDSWQKMQQFFQQIFKNAS